MGENAKTAERLRAGETVSFRPRGNSMTGRIEDGQLVTVAPFPEHEECEGTGETWNGSDWSGHKDCEGCAGSGRLVSVEVGDVVLAKVNGHVYLHLVKAIGSDGRVQIGNNRGRINGWAARAGVYGKLVRVEP